MRIRPAKLLAQFISGLSVLLLAASQEKLCPWLEEVPAPSKHASPAARQMAADDRSDSNEPLPPTLGNTLPDVVAPRWPDRTRTASVQVLRGKVAHLSLTGQDDDQGTGAGAWQAAAGVPPWGIRLELTAEACGASACGQLHFAHDGTFLTSISRTGPPTG